MLSDRAPSEAVVPNLLFKFCVKTDLRNIQIERIGHSRTLHYVLGAPCFPCVMPLRGSLPLQAQQICAACQNLPRTKGG